MNTSKDLEQWDDSFTFPLRKKEEGAVGASVKKEEAPTVAVKTEEIDWDVYSFPPIPPDDTEKETSVEAKEEGEESASSSGLPVMQTVLENKWVYYESEGVLKNLELKKKIDLKDLVDPEKIVLFLNLTELREKWNYKSLRRSLEKACWIKFDMGLDELLQKYPHGSKIPWKKVEDKKEMSLVPEQEPTMNPKHTVPKNKLLKQ